MSNGCVIFAIDNGDFEYTRLADVAAGLVKKHLGIPTTIITNKIPTLKYAADYILIDADTYSMRTMYDKKDCVKIKWFNHTRPCAYELSPYDKTILIDADFLMFNESLKKLFETDQDFLCWRDVYDPTGRDGFRMSKLVSEYSIQNAWATVCYFTKSDKAKDVFDMMKYVRDNYDYYHRLIGVQAEPYRNDFALAIALHALSGYGVDIKTIPGAMTMFDLDVTIEDFNAKRGLVYTFPKNGKISKSFLKGHNIHILGKWDIQKEALLKKIEATL